MGHSVSAAFSMRRFADTDLVTLQRLVSEMQDHERAIDPRLSPGDVMASHYAVSMIARCDAEDGVIIVAESGAEAVGFVAVVSAAPYGGLDQPPGTHALVTDLAVTPSFRDRGVGRALLEAAEEFARSRGAAELRIAVLAGNHPAAHLYASVGFVPYLTTLSKDLRS